MREIIPQPGYVAQDIRDLLFTKQFVFADLFTLHTKYDDKLRYCTAQKDVNIFPLDEPTPVLRRNYSASGLKIQGLILKIGTGVEVDEQEATLQYDTNLTYKGLKIQDALRLSRFDGTRIRRDRVYAPYWGAPWLGGVQMFGGRLSTIDNIGRISASLKVKSDLLLLNVSMPRNLFQPSCLHTIFDPGCTLNRASYATAGTTEVGSTSSAIKWTPASADYAQGRIDINDGSGVLQIRTIQRVVGDTMYLSYPLDFEPTDGMLFTAYPGCSRIYNRCDDFSNTANFRGFPFVPVAETAY